MNKALLVSRHEYLHHVSRARFWIALLAIPLGIALISLISVLITFAGQQQKPVGYIDEGGLIRQKQLLAEKENFFNPQLHLLPYTNEEQARIAVDANEIQGFVVIPADYQQSYHVRYFGERAPNDTIRSEIKILIQQNLINGRELVNLTEIEANKQIVPQSLSEENTSKAQGFMGAIVPLIVCVVYIFTIITSVAYLLQALVEEKENRTMEIMITSTSPHQLMTGKIVGNIGVGLTQIAFWGILMALALLIFKNKLSFLSQMSISWTMLAYSLLLTVPSFVFSAALIAILGASFAQVQEAQAVTGLITLPMLLPLYLLNIFITNPNAGIARFLSYFPLSAPLGMTLRMAFGEVPAWEIWLTFLGLLIACVGAFYLAGKAFRAGMLSYGKRIPLRELFKQEAKNA